ncbi:MAG: hypothetical protein AABX14_02520 [Candidatus Aenigmatarchaeota archaeon]
MPIEAISNLFKDKDFRKIVIIFAICKIFVIVIAVGTQFFIPADITHTEKVTDNIFLNPFAQYDATAYLYIAEHGYTSDFGGYHAANYHWYPLYPLLIRVFGFIGYPLAAFLIANIASFLAVTMLWLLVRDELGKKIASKTIIYMLLFPTAFYFTVMYTEALFLFLSVSVFYFAKKGQWKYVGLLGFLVALTRIQGILLLIPAGYIYLRSIGFDYKKIGKKALYFVGFPAGMLLFMIYEYLVLGDILAQFKSSIAYGKFLAWPWEGFQQALYALTIDSTPINIGYHVINLFLTISFIVLLYFSFKKLKLEYTIYYLITLVIILISSNLFGITRYMLVVFPMFMVLASLDNRRWYVKYSIILIYIFFIALMGLSIILHVTERASLSFLYTPIA